MFNWIKKALKGGDNRVMIPEWANSGCWSNVAYELSKYQLGLRVADPRHAVMNLDLSRYNKSEQKAAGLVGWLFLQALIDESSKREELELQLQSMTDQLNILKECLRSSEKHKEEVQAQFSNYVVSKVNKQRKKKGRRLPGKSSALKVRTLVTKGDWEELAQWSGSDSDEEIEFLAEIEPEVRPVVTTRQRREVTERAHLADERNDFAAQAAEQQYTEETRSYTAAELTELRFKFAQKPGEDLLKWLVRVWDLGGDGILLSNREAIGLGSMARDPRVRLFMRRARSTTVIFSLLHLIRDSIIQVYDTPTELMNSNSWSSIGEGIQRLREYGCVSGLIKDPLDGNVHDNWTGPDMSLFTVHMKNKLLAGAPSYLKASLFTMLSAIDAKKERVHEAAALLGQLAELEGAGQRVKQRSVAEKRPAGRMKITRKQLFQDLVNSGISASDIDGIPTSELFKIWKQLQAKGTLKIAQPKRVSTSDVEEVHSLPSAPPPEGNFNPYGRASEELMKHKQKFNSRGWEVPHPLD